MLAPNARFAPFVFATVVAGALATLVAACAGGSPPANPDGTTPPGDAATTPTEVPAWRSAVATRQDAVVDNYHGTEVADPFRWLEDQDGAEVAEWVKAQNVQSRAFLDRSSARPAIRSRLAELWNYERHGNLFQQGNRWFYSRNDGLQNQSVLFTTDDPAQTGRVLLDPNALSTDGTVAIAGLSVDETGARLAYATSAQGSDWTEWRVRDVATGEDLPDRLRWCKFSGAAWTHDGRGFFYQRFPEPAKGEVFEQQTQSPQLCYHVLGTEQSTDRVVYERPDQPKWLFGSQVSEDGRFLIISLRSGSASHNRLACVDLQQQDWAVQPLLMNADATYNFVGNDGDTFYLRTNKDAPLGRIVALDRTAGLEPPLTTRIAESAHALQGVTMVADRFACSYLEDASTRLRLFQVDGTAAGEIPLPDIGSADIGGNRKDQEAVITFTSFLYPTTVYRYRFADQQMVPFRAPKLKFDAGDYEVHRVFPQSNVGVRLCLFLVHKKGIRLDGSNPTYLYGYGGFNVPMQPSFSIARLAWLERGGVYAQAVLRGGSEYGEAWHEAGMLGNKQNVFDDFIACAQYLQRNGYCDRNRLAIGGGSNGGLLVGACLTQRPELFGAAIPEVGVLDMLRYHKFTIGWAWASEYGSSDDASAFRWLHAYSPLHNIRAGTVYPPTMVMTGDHDDRVLPGHSFKFAAALQEAQGGSAPVLIRIETDAGHGAGKPLAKQIDEAADRWAFLAEVIGG